MVVVVVLSFNVQGRSVAVGLRRAWPREAKYGPEPPEGSQEMHPVVVQSNMGTAVRSSRLTQ